MFLYLLSNNIPIKFSQSKLNAILTKQYIFLVYVFFLILSSEWVNHFYTLSNFLEIRVKAKKRILFLIMLSTLTFSLLSERHGLNIVCVQLFCAKLYEQNELRLTENRKTEKYQREWNTECTK